MSDSILAADEKRILDAEIFNKRFLSALKTGVGPVGFAWRDTVNGNQWMPSPDPKDYRTTGYERAMRSAAAKEDALARAVSRDPCRVCGTRADIGCRHQRVA